MFISLRTCITLSIVIEIFWIYVSLWNLASILRSSSLRFLYYDLKCSGYNYDSYSKYSQM